MLIWFCIITLTVAIGFQTVGINRLIKDNEQLEEDVIVLYLVCTELEERINRGE